MQSLQSILEVANRLNKNPLTVFELSVLYNEIPENYKKNLLDPYLSTEKIWLEFLHELKTLKI